MDTSPIHVGNLRAYHKGGTRWQIQHRGGDYVRSLKSTRTAVEEWMRSQQLTETDEAAPEAAPETAPETEIKTALGNLDDVIKLVASSFRALGWERLTAFGVTITLAGQNDE